ncbi:MerR family transcriptional regulator [Amedibacillus sp. YH-ame6]
MASIKEVSERYDISQDTLRYYERIHLIPPVHRTPGGIRDYQKEDTKWVEFIKCMRSAGLSIESLIEYVAMFQEGDSTIAARKELLLEQRTLLTKRMEEMKMTLERLNQKIEGYETRVLTGEKKLKRKEENK